MTRIHTTGTIPCKTDDDDHDVEEEIPGQGKAEECSSHHLSSHSVIEMTGGENCEGW